MISPNLQRIRNLTPYLIGLFPACLISGPLLTEIISFLLILLFLIFLSIEKKYYIFKNNIFIIFILFCFYLTLGSLFSDNVFFSLKNSFFYFRFGFLVLAISYFLNNEEKTLNIIYYLFTIAIFFLVLDSFIQIFYGKNIFGYEPLPRYHHLRISSLFGDEYVLGSFLQKIFPIYLYLIFKKFKNHEKLFYFNLFLLAPIISIVFRSGERSAFFLLFLFFLMFLFVNRFMFKKILILFLISLSIMMTFTLTFTDNSGLTNNKNFVEFHIIRTYDQIFDRKKFWEKNFNDANKKNFYIFSYAHEKQFETAFNMFKDKPIFGHGLKMYRHKCDNYSSSPYGCSSHPHNTYIQLLAETGLIGFLFVFITFLLIVKKIYFYSINSNKKKYVEISSILLIGIFINLWPFIPTGSFSNNWISFLYYLPIGFYFFEKKYFYENVDSRV